MNTITQIQTALLALNEHYDEATIASKLGVSKRTIYKWWVGTMPRPKTRLRIANLLSDIIREEKKIQAEIHQQNLDTEKAELKAKRQEENRLIGEIAEENNIVWEHRRDEMKTVFNCLELQDSFAFKTICWCMKIPRSGILAVYGKSGSPRDKPIEEFADIIDYVESTYRPLERFISAWYEMDSYEY